MLDKLRKSEDKESQLRNHRPQLWDFPSRNDRTLDIQDHAFEIMTTFSHFDALIPAWYLNQHQAQGITTGHLYFPNCSSRCLGHALLHPEYKITYDKRVALKPNMINIGGMIFNDTSILQNLPKYCHTWSLLYDPEGSDKLPSNK